MNGSQVQMFSSFSNLQIAIFVCTIKWNDISFSIYQKLLWIFSAIIMQDYQFKYISHCLCIFYPEPFNFSAPTLHIIEWKGPCKEFLFVQLFFKSVNIPQATFRGGDWVNDITKNCGAYREIPPLLPDLFLYSHIINGSPLLGKTKSSGKGIGEIYFRKSRMDRQLWRFDDQHVDLKFCDIRMSVNLCTA